MIRAWRASVLVVVGLLFANVAALAQDVDCARLQTMIAQSGRGGDTYAKAARRQEVELARTQAYGHQLGCDSGGFSFFGDSANPQCPAINARINQMQSNLGRLQQGGGGDRAALIARFNAYCRGAPAPKQRGFFESIFGGGQDEAPPPPPPSEIPTTNDDSDDDGGARGGSQAVCVRTCDGGFFPLAMSARHNADSLSEMCTALCPGTEATVFTRRPDSEIKTAVGLDGKPYMDLPNALKYQKNYSPTCSCLPAGKSWAEVLANAENILGNQRKGDIVVTQEKSDELSRPKLDPSTRAALLQNPGTTKVTPQVTGDLVANPQATNKTEVIVGPDGVKRVVRRVGPQP
jgi:hypothetical protein